MKLKLHIALIFLLSSLGTIFSDEANERMRNIIEAQPLSTLGGVTLDKNQIDNIKFIWKHTSEWKEEVAKGDLGRWLIAIAWVESQLGRAMVNMQTYDCGLFHANVKYYLLKHKIKDTPLMRNVYCSTLITNRELALSHSLETIFTFKQFWEKRGYQKTSMHRAIMSFNVGIWKEGGEREKIGLAYFKKVLKIYNEIESKDLELKALMK